MAQTSCDLRWAPLTRHAVLNEELTGLSLIPEAGPPTGRAPHHLTACSEDNSSELQGRSLTSDDLRTEVSLLKTEQEDKLDETRSNEAYPRHVIHQQDPCNDQGPCPSKPFEGLEQCLSWHQRVWGRIPRGCPCQRRNATTSRIQRHTYMRDIAFPISLWSVERDSMRGVEHTMNTTPHSAGMDMRSGAITSNVYRISETVPGVGNTRHQECESTGITAHGCNTPQEYHQHTWPAELCLAETGKTQKELRDMGNMKNGKVVSFKPTRMTFG